MTDVIIPIVFPDYKITVDVPGARFDILPYVEWDNFKIEKSQQKVSNLGHAGVLFINGNSGLSKYYEYGRYDAPGRGIVRKLLIPDARVNKDGVIPSSLIPVLKTISRNAGKNGRVQGVFIEAEGVFDKLQTKAHARKQKNNKPNRKPYSITSNSCIHFVKQIVEAAGKDTPWIIDPRPTSYMGEFRDDYPDLDYSPKKNTLEIDGIGEFSG